MVVVVVQGVLDLNIKEALEYQTQLLEPALLIQLVDIIVVATELEVEETHLRLALLE
jgi:hypothetical protein